MKGTVDLARTRAVIERGISSGQHPGGQIFASVNSTAVAQLIVGESRSGVKMDRHSILPWLSAGKPLTAVALAILIEEGLLELDCPVGEYVPEFSCKGKETITIRHLLTHTGGFRGPESALRTDKWENLVSDICSLPLEPGWKPGETAGYHRSTSWIILAEVLIRVSGVPFIQFLTDRLLSPLGMSNTWLKISASTRSFLGDQLGSSYNTQGERRRVNRWSTPAALARLNPASNVCGPAEDLIKLYEMMLNQGTLGGTRILRPETVVQMTSRQRVGLYDRTIGRQVDWGLGFSIHTPTSGTRSYGFSRYSSARTFGHSGFQSVVGFCDPEFGLAAAAVLNGTPGDQPHRKRMSKILDSVYEDLGLANGTAHP